MATLSIVTLLLVPVTPAVAVEVDPATAPDEVIAELHFSNGRSMTFTRHPSIGSVSIHEQGSLVGVAPVLGSPARSALDAYLRVTPAGSPVPAALLEAPVSSEDLGGRPVVTAPVTKRDLPAPAGPRVSCDYQPFEKPMWEALGVKGGMAYYSEDFVKPKGRVLAAFSFIHNCTPHIQPAKFWAKHRLYFRFGWIWKKYYDLQLAPGFGDVYQEFGKASVRRKVEYTVGWNNTDSLCGVCKYSRSGLFTDG